MVFHRRSIWAHLTIYGDTMCTWRYNCANMQDQVSFVDPTFEIWTQCIGWSPGAVFMYSTFPFPIPITILIILPLSFQLLPSTLCDYPDLLAPPHGSRVRAMFVALFVLLSTY